MSDEVHETESPQTGSVVVEIIKFSIIALLIATPFRLFIAQPFIVSGASMEPTFEPKEYLVIDQLSYRFEEPERGDVIVLRYPQDPAIFFIKRVIGLPGEVIEVGDGVIHVLSDTDSEEVVFTEPYLADENQTGGSATIELEDNEYYVLGDNRRASSDSRVWGPLREDLIVGRVLMRLLPVGEAGIFPGKHHY